MLNKEKTEGKIISPIAKFLYKDENRLEIKIINQFLETIAKDFSLDLTQLLSDEESIVKAVKTNRQIGENTLYGIKMGFSSLLASSFVKKDYNKSINFYQCMIYYFKDLTEVSVKSCEDIEKIKYEQTKEKDTTLVKSKLTAYLSNLTKKEEGTDISVTVMNALLNDIDVIIPGIAKKFCEVESALILYFDADEESKIYVAQSLFNGQIQSICSSYISGNLNEALKSYSEMLEYFSNYYHAEIDSTVFTKQKNQ